MSKPLVVGITGGSGSGKTRFMEQLLQKLPDATLHSMDNYYFPIEQQPRDDNGIENFDTPQSIDTEKYAAHLQQLIAGESLEIKEYTFNNDSSTAQTLHVHPAKVILVEGIFVLALENIRSLLDLKLYIEAPDYLMLSRRILRDAEERGYDLSDVLYRYQHHVTPSFKKYIEPSRHWADLVIPNHTNFDKALNVVHHFLNPS